MKRKKQTLQCEDTSLLLSNDLYQDTDQRQQQRGTSRWMQVQQGMQKWVVTVL